MQQTLFYIPEKIGELPVFGFGIAFAIWLLVVSPFFVFQIRRQGFSEDTKSYIPFALIFGVAIVFIAPLLVEGGGLPIRGYGVMVTLGVVSGVGLSAWQARRMGLDPEVIFSLAFWMFAAGIGGARAFFVIQHWNQFHQEGQTLWQTVQSVANITKGGLVVYGSVFGGLAALVAFCRVRKLPVLALGDLIAPGMLVGLAFGRVGCLLNGCCYGGLCEGSGLAITFPRYADERAGKPSDPYAHQQSLGQLHGFRLKANAKGEAIVSDVAADSPAGKAGLPVASVVRRIELDPFSTLYAAITVPELAGGDLELETDSGRQIHVPIVPRQGKKEPGVSLNEVGFELAEFDSLDRLIVQNVSDGGPADRAGLKPSERLSSLRLPPVPSLAAAEHVMAHVEKMLVLEMADGQRYDVSLPQLPPRSRPVHPTQIYSSIKAGLLALFLYSYYPFRRRDGEVFALMLTLYPLFRILLEVIRDDVPGLFGTSITISQAVSGLILFAGLVLWVKLLRQPRGSVLPPQGVRVAGGGEGAVR